ncbi:hypothetical protein LIER_38698 [Lithospermum erythrorhizon]|uniref:Uncharacterized protein n=1 Tax=Lithospermum erythrorhizon TaxID=34254 RepID=A0AAV3Q7L6_LITER
MSMAYNVGLSALSTTTSSTTPSSTASISFLSSSAATNKERKMDCQSFVYWTFVYLLLAIQFVLT